MTSFSFEGNSVVLKNHNNLKSHKKSPQRKNPPAKNHARQTNPSRKGARKTRSSKSLVKAKIFVGGIPSSFTSQDLLEYFQGFGDFPAIKLKTKKRNKNVNLGFGTITVAKPVAIKILETNFHYIKGHKIECQRFVKTHKSRSKLINDKKIKTLYIIEPPESMDEENLKDFFGHFGKIENSYILPERKVPLPDVPKSASKRAEVDPNLPNFEILKKKALILFETSEAARAAYQMSLDGELVFEGIGIKLEYKWPTRVEKILTERREKAREERRQQLKKEARKEDHGEQDTRKKAKLKERDDLGRGLVKGDRSSRTVIKKPKKRAFKPNSGQENPTKRPTMKRTPTPERGKVPVPVLRIKESGHRVEEGSRKIQSKSERTPKNHKNRERIESAKTQPEKELTQSELLNSIPKSLQRTRNDFRPSYFRGFWGDLGQKLEEHRRSFKPSQTQYKHSQTQPNHSGSNIRIIAQKSALQQTTSSPKHASSIHRLVNTPGGQLQRPHPQTFTQGDRFGQISF